MAGRGSQGAYEALGLAWSLGWRVAAGAWIGYRLDLWLHSSGLLTLLLSLTAMVTGVRAMIRAGRMGTNRPSDSADDKDDKG